MYEILRKLRSDSLVLDVGSDEGSFPRRATSATIVRVDRDVPLHREEGVHFVQCDAASLPFASGIFAAVVSNHSLEHIANFAAALHEIGRVVRPDGSLFVAVPDAATFTDKLYRWLARGGGHINAFTAPDALAKEIERATGLPHRGTRVLCSSLSFLNRRHNPGRRPRRLLLLGAGSEWSLFLYAWLSRRLDRFFKTRTSVYGWAFYFGKIAGTIDTKTWVNVCMRCGSGFSSSFLTEKALVRRARFGVRVYRCPECGVTNSFSPEARSVD
jgi:SAM-dependent methyltransferase